MKKRIKSLLCAVLVVITLFSISAPMVATAATTYENDFPIVYIKGAGREVYSADGKQIMPFMVDPEDQILEQTDRLLAAFMSSVLSKDWDTYCDELVEVVTEVYKDVVLDKNGEASDGSYIIPSGAPKKKTSGFNLSDYVFQYDSRLDPWEVAAQLQSYIKKVLAATGKKKVSIVGRCLGGNYIAAYLTRYGASTLNTAVFYVASTKGTVVCSESFSGKFKFDAELIDTYVNEYMGESDEQMFGFIKALVSVTHQMSILGMGTDLVQSVYDQIADNVVPRLLLASYATMPAYWSMVDDDNYEQAKRLIFGNNTAEYAGLIEKIDRYHYDVMNMFDATMSNLTANGMKVGVVAKYNVALPPLFESSNKQADGTIELFNLSFGANSADMGKTLSKSYLDDLSYSGDLLKYVSDDLIVDASTCLFPDNTWFVKNSVHEHFPTSINKLIYQILRTKKQLTVWDNKDYPQYLEYNDDNTLTPVKSAVASGGEDNNFLSGILEIFRKIVDFFKKLFNIL